MKNEKTTTGIENIESALTRTERYIEENQKSLIIIVGVIVLSILAFVGFKKYILQPKEKEAISQMFVAEKYFEQDSFRLALEGDGMNIGFVDIIDEYGITKSANLAQYYAGVSYLWLGDFENAIDHLKKYSGNDKILGAQALGAIGDAYSELQDYSNAATYYQKAVAHDKNEFTAPIYMMKAALVFEKQNNTKKALDVYEQLKKSYPNSTEGRSVDKYIAKLKSSTI